eukprot:TRINITY_DN8674_c0_g1_i1.p1 TRINITY_DN8674_c0_g1~~TRINITY_DN8674_c0_g1_i1.p1  ORF type:complete len:234 (+),score=36.00 TRINITY_DN8674_c0_g1_i1:467-1168(+)
MTVKLINLFSISISISFNSSFLSQTKVNDLVKLILLMDTPVIHKLKSSNFQIRSNWLRLKRKGKIQKNGKSELVFFTFSFYLGQIQIFLKQIVFLKKKHKNLQKKKKKMYIYIYLEKYVYLIIQSQYTLKKKRKVQLCNSLSRQIQQHFFFFYKLKKIYLNLLQQQQQLIQLNSKKLAKKSSKPQLYNTNSFSFKVNFFQKFTLWQEDVKLGGILFKIKKKNQTFFLFLIINL